MKLHLECLDVPEPENGYQPEFFTILGQKYEAKRIAVDNHQYAECTFTNCTFVYSGGPFGFRGCEVQGDCYVALTGAAWRANKFWQQFQDHIRKMIPLT